jgi:hypothetical protein
MNQPEVKKILISANTNEEKNPKNSIGCLQLFYSQMATGTIWRLIFKLCTKGEFACISRAYFTSQWLPVNNEYFFYDSIILCYIKKRNVVKKLALNKIKIAKVFHMTDAVLPTHIMS